MDCSNIKILFTFLPVQPLKTIRLQCITNKSNSQPCKRTISSLGTDRGLWPCSRTTQHFLVRGSTGNHTVIHPLLTTELLRDNGKGKSLRLSPLLSTCLWSSSSWALMNSCWMEQSSSLNRPTSSQLFRKRVGVGVWSEI